MSCHYLDNSLKLKNIRPSYPLQARPPQDAEVASAKPVPTPVRSEQLAPAAPAEHLAAKVEPVSEVGYNRAKSYNMFWELLANLVHVKTF